MKYTCDFFPKEFANLIAPRLREKGIKFSITEENTEQYDKVIHCQVFSQSDLNSLSEIEKAIYKKGEHKKLLHNQTEILIL